MNIECENQSLENDEIRIGRSNRGWPLSRAAGLKFVESLEDLVDLVLIKARRVTEQKQRMDSEECCCIRVCNHVRCVSNIC